MKHSLFITSFHMRYEEINKPGYEAIPFTHAVICLPSQDEIIQHILQYLDTASLSRVAQTCS